MKEGDKLARVAAVAGLVLGGLGAVEGTILVADRLINKDNQTLQLKVDKLETQLDQNLIGDCLHENILRESFKAPAIDLKGCKKEREDWQKELNGKQQNQKFNNG